jgi:hypothetical protein
MLPRLALLSVLVGVMPCGLAEAATADQAAVSWTLRATSLEPYKRNDYDPKPGSTPIAGPPGWACTGELFQMREGKPTLGTLAVRCAKGETVVATRVQCSYFDKPKPGAPAKGAYWTSGPYQQMQITAEGETWEFSVGCSVSSRHVGD